MLQNRRFIGFRVIVLMLLTLISINPALTQNKESANAPSNEQATLQALLTEVRLLRLAVQRANTQSYRTQVVLQRLRIQQEHVDRLAHDLEVVRNELGEMAQVREQFAERIRNAGDEINSEPNETVRTEGRRKIKDLEVELEQQKERELTKRQHENELAVQLQSEQTKLTELNNRLESLEREVIEENQQPGDRQSGKRPLD